MKQAEARWDLDLAYGHDGESLVDELLMGRNRKVEVKTQRKIGFDLWIETECDYGRTGRYVPSGISITRADTYACSVATTGIVFLIPTELLRIAIKDFSARSRACDTDGRNRSRGRVVSLVAVMRIAKQLAEVKS